MADNGREDVIWHGAVARTTSEREKNKIVKFYRKTFTGLSRHGLNRKFFIHRGPGGDADMKEIRKNKKQNVQECCVPITNISKSCDIIYNRKIENIDVEDL